jgi:hypothetical protein
VRRWFTLETVAIGVFVFVGLALVHGRGWRGVAAFVGVSFLVGVVIGFIGRRYPLIYAQNRRDRRRHRSSR